MPGKRDAGMTYLRILWPLAVAASLAACSGNLGGGQSTLPGTMQPGSGTNVQSVTAPTPTASPQSASNIATVGDSTAPQPLPEVMGWTGTIAFSKPIPAPSPSPNAKSTPAASTAVPGTPVSVGITAGVVEPSDAPRFGSSGKRAGAAAPKGLFFISLLSTADVTLGEYPKIAVDVPPDVAAKYHEQVFALALYDPESSAKVYRLAVAERDVTASAVSQPAATATPSPTPSPGEAANAAAALTPPPVGGGVGANVLPPDHVAFLGTAASLTLKSNRPVVFAVYAAPAPAPSPSGSAVPSGAASSQATTSPAASPESGVHASTTSTLPTPAAQASPAPRSSPSAL